jgi:uncharacterized radical SAM superfamily Fe-S cluster-containing enzyme
LADRPYLFYELTNSICSTCLRKVEAKVLIEGDKVFLQKWCPQHKYQKVLISTDVSYFRQQRDFLKPGQLPKKFNTPIRWGCPYDCGLCPDHEQHSCLTLVEVTDHCNLSCPICYSESGPHRPTHRSMEQIRFMLDCVVRNEGEPDVVQISGGEPTIHPDFFAILDEAKGRPIRHLMVNTNGIKIAGDAEFARRLAGYMPRFEIYLQFDSLHEPALRDLRGADLRDVRRKALDRLNDLGISTTLVVTLKKGVNDDQIGEILDFAIKQPCVRGVTFQPVQVAGRTENFDPARDRLTLSEVRQGILNQSSLFAPEDVIPVPCHPDCLAMAYALKVDGQIIPLTSLIDPKLLLSGEGNTIIYEQNPDVRKRIFELFSTNHSPPSAGMALKNLLCCLPAIAAPDNVGYQNIFRIIIMQFLDAYSFDVRSVKKTCVHIAHPDGRIIPFDTFNLFYRDGRERRLEELRALYEDRGVAEPVKLHIAGSAS